MKLQLQVAAIMAVALFSANTADAAPGDCAVASLPTFMAMGDCMTAAGDNATEQAACSDGLADACKTCLQAAGEEALACFPASSPGDCVGADLTAMTTKGTCETTAAGDETAEAACEAAMVAAVSAKCMVCFAQKDAAATEGNPADHFACFAVPAAGDCVTADLTAMTTKDTCETTAAGDATAVAACEAAMVAAVSAKCMVCVAASAAAGAEPSVCFDMAATATTLCCKEGGGLDDADKVGASVDCMFAAVAVLEAADLEPPEADCGADPNPATIAAACKAWIKPKVLGAGKECPAPTPALGTSAPTSSVSFAASVALVLVALRLH